MRNLAALQMLTHWGRVTHICISKLAIIGSDNGLLPERHQAIIWTNAGRVLIRPLGTNVYEILFEIHMFSFKKLHFKMSSAKWHPLCLGLNVLWLIDSLVNYLMDCLYFLQACWSLKLCPIHPSHISTPSSSRCLTSWQRLASSLSQSQIANLHRLVKTSSFIVNHLPNWFANFEH